MSKTCNKYPQYRIDIDIIKKIYISICIGKNKM